MSFLTLGGRTGRTKGSFPNLTSGGYLGFDFHFHGLLALEAWTRAHFTFFEKTACCSLHMMNDWGLTALVRRVRISPVFGIRDKITHILL
jgi:hypothetical protein